MPRKPDFHRNSGERRRESSSSMATSPHFFKVVLAQTIQDGSMQLPLLFVKKHEKSLSEYASLEVSPGKLWKVELKKSEGRAWLHKSWRDFVEYYSIKEGYFLVFRYHDNSSFHVSIYDNASMEIKYPFSAPSNNVSFRAPDGKLKIRQSSHMSAKDRALQRAKAFKTQNPYFIVTMKPSYVSYTGYLYVPESHSYLREKGNNYIRLEGADGRTWSVKCNVDRYTHVRFHSGWCNFAQENHLQDGDVCVFELINSMTMTYRVNIFHIDEHDAAIKQEVDHAASVAKGRVLKKATINFMSKNPHFIVQMSPTYISGKGFMVPMSHSSRHLKDAKEGKTVIILQGSNDRTWMVLYNVAKSCDRGRFGRGWGNFVSDNQLQVGDTCIFEMVSGDAKAYKVTILRAADRF